jgi:hypothetical protein
MLGDLLSPQPACMKRDDRALTAGESAQDHARELLEFLLVLSLDQLVDRISPRAANSVEFSIETGIAQRDDASSASRVKSRLSRSGDGCPGFYPRGFNERRRRPARVGNRFSGRTRGEPMAPRSSVPATSSARQDAVAATALTVVRRALIEGVPVTREVLEREASVNLGASPRDAMRQLDLVAQRLGVSSLG